MVSATDSLKALLTGNPSALVTAVGPGARPVRVPDSVPLHGQRAFTVPSGIDLVVGDDQSLILGGWERARDEPVVRVDVRTVCDPDRISRVYFFDLRAEHGVHVVVIEAPDPDLVLEFADARFARPASVGHIKRDAIAVILDVDDGVTALLGWTPEELIGRQTVDVVHPEDVERAIESWMAMRTGKGSGRIRIRYLHADGRYVWLEVTNENHLDDPELACVVTEIVDISDEMAHIEELRDRERSLARLAQALPIGICHLRLDREIVYMNEPFVDLLGAIDSVDALIRSVSGADRRAVGSAVDDALDGRAGHLEASVFRGFEERRCELTFRTMTDDYGAIDGVIVCAADATDRSRLRSELEHRASHDALSGCLNRAATVSALERSLREHQRVAVAYVDLDRFKSINDELGHAAGDELLRVVAARMRSVTRALDRIGRIGGDEFVVICPQGQGDFGVTALVERLSEAINGDVVFAKQRIPLRASVGAATSLPGELDAEALLSRADAAMYAVKRQNRRRAIRAVP